MEFNKKPIFYKFAIPRKKVILSLIENETERKVSYKKRLIGLLKKAEELSTLCDVEMALIVYSPYSDEPKVFPNLVVMVTKEEFTKKRIKKFISIDMNLFYLNDLSYVIKKNILLIRKIMKENDDDEGSTSNVPHAMTPQIDPLAEIPSMGASIPRNNYQNSTDIPQSPSFIDLLNLNDDDFVTLLDDLSVNNANDQDSNPSNNK
uniref:MADS-box domain-containing protein n=1 Tax=Solanum lycopersicum TaxID=4081 RepID=A0A3Q7IDW9_SOLLC